MATHTVTKTVKTPEGTLSYSHDYTASLSVEVQETVATGSTDAQITFDVDVSEVESIFIVSDQDVTLETNSGSAADDTFSLLANKPLEWQSDSYHANPFSADITDLYITNSSGSTATVIARAIYDATP